MADGDLDATTNTKMMGEEQEEKINNDRNGFEGRKEVDKKEKKLTFREQWKDATYREKFMYSMFMAVAFIGLGMIAGQHGATFLDVQILTDTDLESGSVFFVVGTLGYLCGSGLTGIIFDKTNSAMFLFLSTFLMGVANIALPYCRTFLLFMAGRFVVSFFSASVDAGMNAEHLKIWGTEADGLLQALHFAFSAGGVVAPLIAEPFLAEKISPTSHHNTSTDSSSRSLSSNTNSSLNFSFSNASHLILNTTSAFVNSTLNEDSTIKRHTDVEYVFIIIGIFTALSSFPILLIFRRQKSKNGKKKVEKKRQFSRKNVPLWILFLMLFGMCIFYCMYCAVEDIFLSFLMTFLVEEFDSISKSRGAMISAVAWASFAISRFLMIFLASKFSAVKLIFLMTTLMTVSFTAFTICAYLRIVVGLVVFSAVLSLGFSGIFPAGFSWMEKEMFQVTGRVSSAIFIACGIGPMVNPIILGYLMEEEGNMWFCYILLIEVYVMYIVMLALLLFSRYYVDSKFGTLASTSSESDEIEVEEKLSSEIIDTDDKAC